MKRKLNDSDPETNPPKKKLPLECSTALIPEELKNLCVICLYGPPPEWKKVRPTWATILECVLFSLKCLNMDREFFSLGSDIYNFIEEHWDYLDMQKTRDETRWKQTVKMTLSRYNDSFESGFSVLKKRGYWKLKDHVDPYRIPIYQMYPKKLGIVKCRFCAENFESLYNERKFLDSIPSAQIVPLPTIGASQSRPLYTNDGLQSIVPSVFGYPYYQSPSTSTTELRSVEKPYITSFSTTYELSDRPLLTYSKEYSNSLDSASPGSHGTIRTYTSTLTTPDRPTTYVNYGPQYNSSSQYYQITQVTSPPEYFTTTKIEQPHDHTTTNKVCTSHPSSVTKSRISPNEIPDLPPVGTIPQSLVSSTDRSNCPRGSIRSILLN